MGKWISVEDRLPEKNRPVIGSWRHPKYHLKRYAGIRKVGEVVLLDNGYWHCKWREPHGPVTHWQPLPSPPEPPEVE
jgi:hypothetical protein